MKRKLYNVEEEENKLEAFLLLMGEQERQFIEEAKRDAYQLTIDHSIESLKELERYLRDKRVNFYDQTDNSLARRAHCWYYLGEVVRQTYGGFWRFSMNQENTAHWGCYVIEGHTPVEGVEFEPLGLVKGFTEDGYPSPYFLDAILAQVDPENDVIDWDTMPTEE
jgi:hypothetical protein